ncbi:MAG: hypothetical protein R2685_11965 [Candidatus Nitrosocosmicus sp.]|nr:hypothetical protein [Candidatus Nitrosocosmicus sp.]
MALNPYRTTKEERKSRIIIYLTEYPDKEVKDVLNYCEKEEIGSKSTVTEAIKELLAEGKLNSGKKKKNSKSYSLSVNLDNLLLIIPKDLDEIFEQFKIFINKVKQVKRIKKFNNNDITGIDNETTIDDHLSLLQYDIVEIINDVYLFYFVIILPNQLDNDNLIAKLYSIYFGKISEMYSYIASDLYPENNSSDFDINLRFQLYNNYLYSKQLALSGKVSEVVKISEENNIEDDLDNLLRLLWSKNKVAFLLLYKQAETSERKLLLNNEDRNLDTIAKYDIDKKIEEFLYNKKIEKDMFIQRTNGFKLPENDNIE